MLGALVVKRTPQTIFYKKTCAHTHTLRAISIPNNFTAYRPPHTNPSFNFYFANKFAHDPSQREVV